MKINQLLEKLNFYKSGTFVMMEWEKDISSAKAKKQGIKVVKRSSGLIRTEVNYESLKAIQDSERGDKESWFEHYSKGILQHKKDPNKKYLQAFPIPGKKIKNIMVVSDGKSTYECEAHKLCEQGIINKSALSNVENLDTFIIGVENITRFGV